MAAQAIHCGISNCHYWESGNVCKASDILVTSDELANALPEKINAPEAAQIAQTPVTKCTESCCKTFVPKNSFRQNMDGVLKQ